MLVRSLILLQCAVLFIQQGLAVKHQFRNIEEFMQYYFNPRNQIELEEEEESGAEPTTELPERKEKDLTTGLMTTTLSTTTVQTTPHPMVDRCCDLGRYIADNVPDRCHLIDEIDFISKNRNRPFHYNGRPRDGGHASSAYVARQYHHAFETCASYHARALRDEFYRCCKERSLPPYETTLIIPFGPRKRHSKHGSMNRKTV